CGRCGQYVFDEHHTAPTYVTDYNVRRLSMLCHGFKCFSHPMPDPCVMIGHLQISGHRTFGARRRFYSVADDADRWEATVHCLANQADIMSTGSQMLGQRSKLTKTAPVHKSYTHV